MTSHVPLHHLALVSQTTQLGFAELARVSAALQKQASRDLGPVWGFNATCNAFAKLEDAPVDYWPIIVRDDIGVSGAAGVHEDHTGHPFALVQYDSGWSVTASHEMCEMLCDPMGNTTRPGQSPKPGQQRVEFLVEVCDPSEAAQFGYAVNGVAVSDFYTPHFFDPVAVAGVRYSFTGALTKPRQVLQGGYLSWHDPVGDHWWQQTWFGKKASFRDLGQLTQSTKSIRRQIYDVTPQSFAPRKPDKKMALLASGSIGRATEAGTPRAARISSMVTALLKKKR